MARREIGQEEMFGRDAAPTRLVALEAGIDWGRIDALLSKVYAARRGEKAWPPLALYKALLLGMWHDLSDVRLAEALDDRASFRRFCGFSRSEPEPERTAFVRFRRELARRKTLEAKLFDEITRQLKSQGLMVATGTLVDATIIEAVPGLDDDEARWSAYAKRRPIQGYKAHIATDRDSALIKRVHVTTANVLDGRVVDKVLDRRPGEVFADKGYDWGSVERAIRARGGAPRIMRRGNKRSRPERILAINAWNAGIKPIRAAVEKVFGTAKRSYGLRRMRWRGLRNASIQIHLAFTV